MAFSLIESYLRQRDGQAEACLVSLYRQFEQKQPSGWKLLVSPFRRIAIHSYEWTPCAGKGLMGHNHRQGPRNPCTRPVKLMWAMFREACMSSDVLHTWWTVMGYAALVILFLYVYPGW